MLRVRRYSWLVSAGCDANLVGVCLLWAKNYKKVYIRHRLQFGGVGDLIVSHDNIWVCSLLSHFKVTLHHSAKILAKCCLLHFSCGGVVQWPLVAADSFACDGVYHRHCHLQVVKAHWRWGWHQIFWREDVRRLCPNTFGKIINCLLTDYWWVTYSPRNMSKMGLWDAHGRLW